MLCITSTGALSHISNYQHMNVVNTIIKYKIVKAYSCITDEHIGLIYKYDNGQLYIVHVELNIHTSDVCKYYIKRYKPYDIITIIIRNVNYIPYSAISKIICFTNDVDIIDRMCSKYFIHNIKLYKRITCSTILQICTDDVIIYYYDYIRKYKVHTDIMSKQSERVIDTFIHTYSPYEIASLLEHIPVNAKYKFLQKHIDDDQLDVVAEEIIHYKHIYKEYYYKLIDMPPSYKISQLLYKYGRVSDYESYII